jgi:hypothetical protein
MAHALFSFRQLPTVAAMLAERGLALDALMKEAGFRAPATTEVTAPLDKVQVLLELVAQKPRRCAAASTRPRRRPTSLKTPRPIYGRQRTSHDGTVGPSR